MAEIINLRRARKARARTEAAAKADANRIAHGTPTALKDLARARRDQADHQLDGAKRGGPDEAS
jgi:hypothetical protein